MDFNLTTYKKLLNSLHLQSFLFYTVSDYFSNPDVGTPFVLLRHDVEKKYENALQMAQLQHDLGIKGSYYFRLLHKSGNEAIIKEIAALGHEIGYHYDDLSECSGNYEKAIQRFQQNIAYLRQFAPVTSITMEGAPLSKYDNRQLWEKYNYRDFGIIAEPYFDLDFDEIFYLTDTGRRWDGWRMSIRDKVPQQEEWNKKGLIFHSTRDIIHAASEGRLPDKIMMTFHPQRWDDKPLRWLKELVFQGVKNQVKRVLVKVRSKE
jgi:hypothetical protein